MKVRLVPTSLNTPLTPVFAQMQGPATTADQSLWRSVPAASATFATAVIPKEIQDSPKM